MYKHRFSHKYTQVKSTILGGIISETENVNYDMLSQVLPITRWQYTAAKQELHNDWGGLVALYSAVRIQQFLYIMLLKEVYNL
jgi:hypothetical protein